MEIGIGLDVGGTKVRGCALDGHGNLLAEVRQPSASTNETLLAVLMGCTESLLSDLGDLKQDVRGVGVGLPGLVNDAGVLHEAPNLDGLRDLDLPAVMSPELSKLLGPPEGASGKGWRLLVDKETTFATAAEHVWGAGKGCADFVFVALGTGLGGGVVSGGQFMRGAGNFAGEIGHMVIDPSGPLCGCGRRGCWERFCSGTGLAFLAQRAVVAGGAPHLLELAGGTVEAVRGEQVVLAAQQGDPGALRVIVEFGGYLATGLNNLVQLFDPVRIVLGGGLVSAGDLLLGPGLDTYSATRRRGSGLQAVPVVFATFGEGASAYGAAALSLGVVNPRAGTAGCKFMHVQPRAATVPGRKSSYV